jgi:hypothetical protein
MFTNNPVENFVIWLAILYLIPTWIALLGNSRDKFAIFALNLLAGWTFVGWLAAFIWSLRGKPQRFSR